MLAENLKADYYRSKVRPPPPCINDHHLGIGDGFHALEAAFDTSLPNADEAALLRQASLSSASLLGDLNGKPLFYIPAMVGDADPLFLEMRSHKASLTSSASMSTSPGSSKVATPSGDAPAIPELSDIFEVLVAPVSISRSSHKRTSKNRKNKAKQNTPTHQEGRELSQVVSESTVLETTPASKSTKIGSSHPKVEEPLSNNTLDAGEKNSSIHNEDDDESGFIEVTGRKKNRQPRTSVAFSLSAAPPPSAATSRKIGRRISPPVLNPPAPSRIGSGKKKTRDSPDVASPVAACQIPVPEPLARQHSDLVTFMLNSWTSFTQAMH